MVRSVLGHSVKSVDSMKKSQNGWGKSNLELLVPSIASSWFFISSPKRRSRPPSYWKLDLNMCFKRMTLHTSENGNVKKPNELFRKFMGLSRSRFMW